MERPLVSPEVEQSGVANELLCQEVTTGSIVLMQRVDSHPLTGCPGGICQSITKRIMTFVSNTDPVHSTQYDRLVRTEQHDSTTAQC